MAVISTSVCLTIPDYVKILGPLKTLSHQRGPKQGAGGRPALVEPAGAQRPVNNVVPRVSVRFSSC